MNEIKLPFWLSAVIEVLLSIRTDVGIQFTKTADSKSIEIIKFPSKHLPIFTSIQFPGINLSIFISVLVEITVTTHLRYGNNIWFTCSLAAGHCWTDTFQANALGNKLKKVKDKKGKITEDSSSH